MTRLLSLLLAIGIAAASVPFASAQRPIVHPESVFVRAEPAGPGGGPNVAPPPRVLADRPAKHGMPDVPQIDAGLPMPNNPPSGPRGVGPAAPCDIDFRANNATAIAVGSVGEPTVSLAGSTNPNATVGFATGNWYASLSTDSGASWGYISPYTRFPALDGGFCCDQVAIYEPSRDVTVWYLQYDYSQLTQRGSARVAYAVGSQLGANVWASYVFTPQTFGRPVGV